MLIGRGMGKGVVTSLMKMMIEENHLGMVMQGPFWEG